MIKNILVVDEQGNEYEATYPKRAKGLVKNGRARFVDENKICLACPPNVNLEDHIMEDKTIITAEVTKIEDDAAQTLQMSTDAAESLQDSEKVVEQSEQSGNETSDAHDNSKYTLEYIMTQLEVLRNQLDFTSTTNSLVATLGAITSDSGEIKIKAIDSIRMMYIAHQNSIQQMLGFYEKMYDELRLRSNSPEATRAEIMMKVLSFSWDDEDMRDSMLNTVRHILEML